MGSFVSQSMMSIVVFVILLRLLVARAINARGVSPPRLVLLTSRRYGFPSGNSSLVLLHWRHRRLSFLPIGSATALHGAYCVCTCYSYRVSTGYCVR